MIVTNALYAEIDRLRTRVAELEAALTEERQRTRVSEAVIRENEALTVENLFQMINPCNHTGFESEPCDVCGYPDPRKLIAKLKGAK